MTHKKNRNILDSSYGLKEIRKSCGYTQQELAEQLGIADSTLAHYESGIRKITLEMFIRILDACKYEIKIQKRQ